MTEAELTILSLVAEGPRYGYEIQQIIDERGLREWLVIGFSSIYYLLNKLESQGMLTSQLQTAGHGPARKVFQVTEAGQGILQTSVLERLRRPRALGVGFELGLANLNAISSQQAHQALTQHELDLVRQLDVVEKIWARHQQDDHPVEDHIHALYTHSITVMQAELTWLREFLAQWRVRYPAASSEKPPAKAAEPSSTGEIDRARVLQRLQRPSSPREE